MIPEEIVERVREEADAISIIGEYVKLKRVGSSSRGPCPFHGGTHNNFSVSARGGYKCFVCGESGDVFTFMQKHLGLDFVEAVKLVGAKAGIEVTETARRTEERDSREPLWELNEAAADFFRTQLWESPVGKTARGYLESRGFSRADADRFGLGFAPRDGSLSESLRTLGFDDARQIAAGLLVTSDERPEPRARFRDRLIIPIHDAAGHLVGFGGRLLGDGQPKYLNSAESEIFSKRKLLYGLHWAKQAVRKAERLIVVEGYFDVMRLMLAGVQEVVAPMGTALTEQQAALIRKYTKHVYLLYDSDQAGLKATFRSGDELLANGVAVHVISLPDGEDPDTFVAKAGAEGFERAAAASLDVFDRKIQILERGGWLTDLRRRREAIDRLLPTIRVTSDRLLRDMYIARTSDSAGVSREELVRELSATPHPRRAAAAPEPGPPPEQSPPPEPAAQVRRRDRRLDHQQTGVRAERELVRVLLHHRRYVEPTAERIGAETFTDPVYRTLFTELTAEDPEIAVDALAASLDEETTETLQELLNEPGGMDRPDEQVTASVNALLSRDLAARLVEIDRLLPLADGDEKDDLIREKEKLRVELNALGRPRWKQFTAARRR